jgi:hypothetical protein
MAVVDPDQAAALRWLGAAFGFVEVLEVVDHEADQDGRQCSRRGLVARQS